MINSKSPYLPGYVFKERYDFLYYFWYDLCLASDSQDFYQMLNRFSQLLGQKKLYLRSVNAYDLDKKIIVFHSDQDYMKQWYNFKSGSDEDVILTRTPCLCLYDDSSKWCMYYDLTAELIVFGVKKEINGLFLQSLSELKEKSHDREMQVSLRDYLEYLVKTNPGNKVTEKFVEKMQENYGYKE